MTEGCRRARFDTAGMTHRARRCYKRAMPEFRMLIDGYRRFRAGPYMEQRRRFDQLANKGQAPKVMIIACSDSRVDPTRVFDTEPGQAFVLRNVANLVPPYHAR